MSDTSDPLEILNAVDRERGESFIGMIQANQVQRLRGEIVALRQAMTHDSAAIATLCNHARDEALEEAARVCEGGYTTGSTASTLKAVAAAIRALKELNHA